MPPPMPGCHARETLGFGAMAGCQSGVPAASGANWMDERVSLTEGRYDAAGIGGAPSQAARTPNTTVSRGETFHVSRRKPDAWLRRSVSRGTSDWVTQTGAAGP